MKLFIILILSLVYLFGAIWVFNHINPWVAFGMVIAFAAYGIYKLENLKK